MAFFQPSARHSGGSLSAGCTSNFDNESVCFVTAYILAYDIPHLSIAVLFYNLIFVFSFFLFNFSIFLFTYYFIGQLKDSSE